MGGRGVRGGLPRHRCPNPCRSDHELSRAACQAQRIVPAPLAAPHQRVHIARSGGVNTPSILSETAGATHVARPLKTYMGALMRAA